MQAKKAKFFDEETKEAYIKKIIELAIVDEKRHHIIWNIARDEDSEFKSVRGAIQLYIKLYVKALKISMPVEMQVFWNNPALTTIEKISECLEQLNIKILRFFFKLAAKDYRHGEVFFDLESATDISGEILNYVYS